jgi:hypothetical protein
MEKKATLIFGFLQSPSQKANNQMSAIIKYIRSGESNIKGTFDVNFAYQKFFATDPKYITNYVPTI